MFDIPDAKIFKDSVHGYISVPKCFVEHLIDTKEFQRLRNIDQTGMRVLYPSAKHDRFSHSLGVFHLGCKAADALLENFSHEDYWNISSDNKKLIFWAKNKILFLIACLLHDIGHAPFSHSLENIVLDNSGGTNRFLQRLVDKLNKNEGWGENIKENDIKAAAHEEIGAMFIIEHMAKAIEAVFDDLIQLQYPSVGAGNILYAEHYSYNPVIDKEGLEQDIYFIARMILGLKYSGYEPEKQIRNCFIELLNGSNFDVDKLDYVIRDTQMSGISNVNVDVERLLSSVCIVTKTRYINKKYQSEDFANYVISRLSGDVASDLRIKGHFRGNILLRGGAEVTVAAKSTFLSLSPVENAKIKYAEFEEEARFSEDTVIVQNGNEITRVIKLKESLQLVKALSANDGNYFDCNIRNAEVVDRDFCFMVQDEERYSNKSIEIRINGYCDIRVKGKFVVKSAVTCFNDTRLHGCVKEIILLGNTIKNEVPNKEAYNEFSVGFQKKAINVIANLLEARNYLYLWVYAHHKVIYYANFLIPAVSCEALRQVVNQQSHLKKILEKEKSEEEMEDICLGLLSMWSLNYEDIRYLEDVYLWTVIKNYYYRGLADGMEWMCLCEELLSRRYKVSLYKSLAEYDLLFEAFTEEQRQYIRNYVCGYIRKDLPCIMEDGDIIAGYLKEEMVEELKANNNLANITNIVCVSVSYKANKLNVDETFIEMSEGSVAPISEISLLADRVIQSKNQDHYFYLYYDTSTQDIRERKREALRLKEAIKNFFVKKLDNPKK